MCDMTYSYVSPNTFIRVTWLIIYLNTSDKWVMAHIWMSHDTGPLRTELHCTAKWNYVWHDSLICVTRLTHTYYMTHSYVWHDSFECGTWLTHTYYMTHSSVYINHMNCSIGLWQTELHHTAIWVYVWHDSLVCVTWLTHMRRMTHVCYMTHSSVYMYQMTHSLGPWQTELHHTAIWLYVLHNSLIFVITHSYMLHDSLICFTWLTHVCHMTHSCVSRDSFMCVYVSHESFLRTMADWHCRLSYTALPYDCICYITHSLILRDSLIRVTWLTHMRYRTDSFVSRDSLMCFTELTHLTWLIHVCICITWTVP